MARSRFIKPDFFDDPVLARCSHPARLLFVATWQVADRSGVFEWDEAKLRKYAFGYEDVTAAQVQGMLRELLAAGSLKHGLFNGKSYGFVCNLAKHQKFHVAEKARFDDVAAGTIWRASLENDTEHPAGTMPAPTQHPADTVPESPSLETETETETENGDGELSLQTAAPSASAVTRRKKRSPTQVERSRAIGARYRERYQQAEGHPPSAMDAAVNGILAKFADTHADNAWPILDWFFDAPDPYYKRAGWDVRLLLTQAPKLWRELNDPQRAIENLAAPAQTRQLALAANNELAYQEFLRRKESRDAGK